MERKEKQMKKFIIQVIETIIGSFIMAAAVSLFLLPNELSSGGFSGIATVTYYLFNIPMGITILALNIPLFLLSTLKIGKDFLGKSIIGTVSLSIFIDILDKFEPLTQDKILACVYGGILTGIGTALILRANSSTGGSDLASIMIKEYKPMFRTGNLITIIDFIIIFLNVIFLEKIEIGLYSAIAIYLMGKVIDILFEGIYFTKLLFIISDKNEEISKFIENEVKRGVTGIYGKGMYTNKEKLILMCAIGRNNLAEIKTKIKQIDPKAFLIITNSREVLGVGFKEK
jgi:uncharacterized membrane-anchored protein YitT (DUF2179 family)